MGMGLHGSTRCICQYLMKLEFSPQIFKKISKSANFMKMFLVGAELFGVERWSDRRTDRHNGANNRFFRNLANASKKELIILVKILHTLGDR
jgi:hypothetical protein